MKRDKFRDELMTEIKDLKKISTEQYEENKAQHENIFFELDKLRTDYKLQVYIDDHQTKLYAIFDVFCKKNDLPKDFADLLKNGIKENLELFARLIKLDLDKKYIDAQYIAKEIKSSFRALRRSNIYTELNIEDKEQFKTELKIIFQPLIENLVAEFRANKPTKKNGELILLFSELNVNLCKQVILKSTNLYKKYKK